VENSLLSNSIPYTWGDERITGLPPYLSRTRDNRHQRVECQHAASPVGCYRPNKALTELVFKLWSAQSLLDCMQFGRGQTERTYHVSARFPAEKHTRAPFPSKTRVTPRHSHTTRTVRWLYSCFLWVVPLFVSPLSCNLLFEQFLRANVAFGRPNTRRADPNHRESHLAGSGTGFLSYGASFPLILITTPTAAPSRNAKGSATILLPGRCTHTHTKAVFAN